MRKCYFLEIDLEFRRSKGGGDAWVDLYARPLHLSAPIPVKAYQLLEEGPA